MLSLCMIILIIFIMYIVSCKKTNNTLQAGNNIFYNYYKNKKCSNEYDIIKTSNIYKCKNTCFKSSECECMSYNVKTQDCILSNNKDPTKLINTDLTLSLIKKNSSSKYIPSNLFYLQTTNSKTLGVYYSINPNNTKIAEIIYLDNTNHYNYID